jgi:Na+-translocating ferredoxin:NAD+ oxidoreductase RNF subunit RnfB
MLTTIIMSASVMLGIGSLFSGLLVVANRRLAVHVDPREATITSALPGANCGGCGFASCALYAKAVSAGTVDISHCSVGGPPVAKHLASILGVDTEIADFPFRPVIHCSATEDQRLLRSDYHGEPTCAAAHVTGGVQGCTYGCLGFGDCVVSCEFDAMTMVDGLPVINYENCIGCGACVRACPREIIEQIPFKVDRMLVVGCSNHDPGNAVRSVCKVGCIGCSMCARREPEFFAITNNLAVIDYDHLDAKEDLHDVQSKCPMESWVYLGKPTAYKV